MKITYKLNAHTTRPDTPVVEVWMGKQFLGSITEDGASTPEQLHLRFISKYLSPDSMAQLSFDPPMHAAGGRAVGSVEIKLRTV